MPNEIDSTKILEFLKRNSSVVPKFCDNCGTPHTEEDMQVLGMKNSAISCRLHCHNCGVTHILNVAMPVNGVGVASRAPISVDVSSAEEFTKFAGKEAVTTDDAIASYKAMSKFKDVGDFIKALRR